MRSTAVARTAALVLSLVSLSLAQADNAGIVQDCPLQGLVAYPGKDKPINSVLQFLRDRDPNYAHIIDGYFMFDARKMPDAVHVSAAGFDLSGPNAKTQMNIVNALTFNATHTGATTPATRAAFFAQLAASSGTLSPGAKMLLLSSLGDSLSGCYDNAAATNGNFTSQDQVWMGLKTGGNCGVCRDIHTFLADAAKALGFEAVGTHTGLWNNGSEEGRHEIAHYRDPKTGEYYVQNYTSIINTHQTTLTGAVDVSTRVLGPLSGTSYVESKPGVVHVYQPRTARWVKSVLEDASAFKSGQAMITYNLGNIEKSAGINLSEQVGPVGFKGFGTVNDYATSEGHFRVEAVGISTQVAKDYKLSNPILTETGFALQATGGYLHFNAPIVAGSQPAAAQPDGTYSRDNFFALAKVKGYAKFNKVTGQIELNASNIDFKTTDNSTQPYVSMDASIFYQPTSALKAGITRRMEITHDDNTHENSIAATTYDKISVIVDARIGKVYIYNKGELYLFQGLEKMSAIGVRDYFRATVPAGMLGDFSVFGDVSAIVSNPSGDPFYQAATSAIVGIDWSKPIVDQYLSIGGKLQYDVTGKLPYHAFEDGSKVTPEMERVPGVTGMVWLHGSF